jgi:hypothetical protein
MNWVLISQKTTFFIVTAVKCSNLARKRCSTCICFGEIYCLLLGGGRVSEASNKRQASSSEP